MNNTIKKKYIFAFVTVYDRYMHLTILLVALFRHSCCT